MEPIYSQKFLVDNNSTDRFGRMKPSAILSYVQEVAGKHFDILDRSLDSVGRKGLFWAVIRHRVQIERLPAAGETITLETWPMPTTRVAYPRSTVAYDAEGNVLFRSLCLWVLMNLDTRAMILPGKSGISVPGTVRGLELANPNSLMPKPLMHVQRRTVRYSHLDVNGHMNNTHYLDWVEDLLPSPFHENCPAHDFTICYHAEATEGQNLDLHWELLEGGILQVDAYQENPEDPAHPGRAFSVQVLY